MSKPDPFAKWTKECKWVVIKFHFQVIAVYGPFTMNDAKLFARQDESYTAFPVNTLEGMETFSGRSD